MAIKSTKVSLSGRERRKIRIRKRVEGSDERPRLTIFKSSKHTYAQAICDVTGKTLASASTCESEVMAEVTKLVGANKGKEGFKDTASTKSVNAAHIVGVMLAKRAIEQKISKVVFDRNGFLYAGRIKAVADGARSAGLVF